MSRRSRCLLSSQMEKYVVMRADRDAITRGSRYIHLAMSKEIQTEIYKYNWNVREKRISGSASREDAVQFSGIKPEEFSFVVISDLASSYNYKWSLWYAELWWKWYAQAQHRAGNFICMPGIKSKWNLIYSFFSSVSWASRNGKNA